jgi:hypothetical protein
MSFLERPTEEEIVQSRTRALAEVVREMRRLESLVWLERILLSAEEGTLPARVAQKYRQQLEKLYGPGFSESWRGAGGSSDFSWGMLNGKLSALRWVLGCEWDFLDT